MHPEALDVAPVFVEPQPLEILEMGLPCIFLGSPSFQTLWWTALGPSPTCIVGRQAHMSVLCRPNPQRPDREKAVGITARKPTRTARNRRGLSAPTEVVDPCGDQIVGEMFWVVC